MWLRVWHDKSLKIHGYKTSMKNYDLIILTVLLAVRGCNNFTSPMETSIYFITQLPSHPRDKLLRSLRSKSISISARSLLKSKKLNQWGKVLGWKIARDVEPGLIKTHKQGGGGREIGSVHQWNVRLLKKACNFLRAERVKAVDMNIYTGQIMMRMHARAHPRIFFPPVLATRLAVSHAEYSDWSIESPLHV